VVYVKGLSLAFHHPRWNGLILIVLLVVVEHYTLWFLCHLEMIQNLFHVHSLLQSVFLGYRTSSGRSRRVKYAHTSTLARQSCLSAFLIILLGDSGSCLLCVVRWGITANAPPIVITYQPRDASLLEREADRYLVVIFLWGNKNESRKETPTIEGGPSPASLLTYQGC
jgi:hypothetical protein